MNEYFSCFLNLLRERVQLYIDIVNINKRDSSLSLSLFISFVWILKKISEREKGAGVSSYWWMENDNSWPGVYSLELLF